MDSVVNCSQPELLRENGSKLVDMLENDVPYLMNGLTEARSIYKEKFAKNVPNKTLKELNWNIVEYNTLLQQAQQLKQVVTNTLVLVTSNETEEKKNARTAAVKKVGSKIKSYLSDVYKKKRTAASHVLVTMLSEEKREKKPYALPVRYISYDSLKDQQLRELNIELKKKMVDRGLKLVGMSALCLIF